MDLQILEQLLIENKIPKYRFKQITDTYFSKPITSFQDIKGIPKDLALLLSEKMPFCTLQYKDHVETGDVIKYVFTLVSSGALIEAVVMKHDDDRRTLCLSCQSGCPMGCYFCATGTMGLKKNLTASEILDTAREVNRLLGDKNEKITNVVYMGMGEPFANYAPVKQSLHYLHDYLGLGWRRLSVSTCGIVPKILEFAKDFPQVNLAISLHAGTNEKRSKMMPINDTFPIKSLMKACETYIELTNRKIFFEYLVIDGFNDTKEDVIALSKILTHPLYHLNLIRFHATDATQNTYGVVWKAPTKERLDEFMKGIEHTGISYTLRRSFGERVDAACGMLALKNSTKH